MLQKQGFFSTLFLYRTQVINNIQLSMRVKHMTKAELAVSALVVFLITLMVYGVGQSLSY